MSASGIASSSTTLTFRTMPRAHEPPSPPPIVAPTHAPPPRAACAAALANPASWPSAHRYLARAATPILHQDSAPCISPPTLARASLRPGRSAPPVHQRHRAPSAPPLCPCHLASAHTTHACPGWLAQVAPSARTAPQSLFEWPQGALVAARGASSSRRARAAALLAAWTRGPTARNSHRFRQPRGSSDPPGCMCHRGSELRFGPRSSILMTLSAVARSRTLRCTFALRATPISVHSGPQPCAGIAPESRAACSLSSKHINIDEGRHLYMRGPTLPKPACLRGVALAQATADPSCHPHVVRLSCRSGVADSINMPPLAAARPGLTAAHRSAAAERPIASRAPRATCRVALRISSHHPSSSSVLAKAPVTLETLLSQHMSGKINRAPELVVMSDHRPTHALR